MKQQRGFVLWVALVLLSVLAFMIMSEMEIADMQRRITQNAIVDARATSNIDQTGLDPEKSHQPASLFHVLVYPN